MGMLGHYPKGYEGAAMTTEAQAEHVARSLRRNGLNAVSWDSGGGMVGIGIAPGGTPPDELRFFFGTADEQWAGEVLAEEGETIAGVATDVDSDESDPEIVAAGIFRALAAYVSHQPGD